MLNKLVPSLNCTNEANYFSCSLVCFKIHKEGCQPKDQPEDGNSGTQSEGIQNLEGILSSSEQLSSEKVKKEYAILSPGQLAILRTIPICPKLIKAKIQM